MRNSDLVAIVLSLGGVVRNPNNRNMILEDWLIALGGTP